MARRLACAEVLWLYSAAVGSDIEFLANIELVLCLLADAPSLSLCTLEDAAMKLAKEMESLILLSDVVSDDAFWLKWLPGRRFEFPMAAMFKFYRQGFCLLFWAFTAGFLD